MTRRLRSYQSEAIDSVAGEASKRNLLVMATGCGKTFTAASFIARHTKRKVLWVAHRTELIDQAAEALEAATGLKCEREKAGSWARDERLGGGSRLIVASVQTLSAKWTNTIRGGRFDPSEFDLVVIDEAHHAAAASYRRIIDHFAGVPLLGLTATPKRADSKRLGSVFDSVPFQYDIRQAVDEGWLVKPRVRTIRLGELDLSTVRTTAGDLNGADLAAVLNAEKPLLKMASTIIKHAGDRSTLVFCQNVEQATRMAEIMRRKESITAEVVTGKTKDDERREMFRAFNAGELQFLVNVGVCVEGTDLPRAAVAAMCRPTKSKGLLTQMIGRVLRTRGADLYDGPVQDRLDAIAASPKPYAEVIDFVGDAGRHKLVAPIDLLGGLDDDVRERAQRIIEDSDEPLDADEAIEKSKEELAREAEEAAAKAEQERLTLEARRAKLFAEVDYTSREVNPFDVFDLPPPTGLRLPTNVEMASGKMVAFLKRHGVAHPELLTKAEANRVNKLIWASIQGRAPSVRQRAMLARHGYNPSSYTKDGANEVISKIMGNRQ